MAGGTLLAKTVRTKALLALAGPSLTRTVIVAVPAWCRAGGSVTVRLAPLPPNTMRPGDTRAGLEELAVRIRSDSGVSTSAIPKAIGPASVSSRIDWLAIGSIVGGSLTEFTVTVKL